MKPCILSLLIAGLSAGVQAAPERFSRSTPESQGVDSKRLLGFVEALDRETFESQVEKGAAWVGTPDTLAEQIRAYDDAIGGFDDASLQVNFNDLSYDDAERSVKLFGAEVMPAFTG